MVDVLAELVQLRQAMEQIEIDEQPSLAVVAPRYRASARNLLHFITFHRRAHPDLAKALRDRGLSSLEGCDAHLLASVTAVITALQSLEGIPTSAQGSVDLPAPALPGPDRRQGLELLRSHCDLLFGAHAAAGAAIMVTLPSEVAQQPGLIRELVEAGMTIARINCAHDGPELWRLCVAMVRDASSALGRDCRIAMDLAGPKLRTGDLAPLPGVIHLRPQRDRLGRLLQPGRILAVPASAVEDLAQASAGLPRLPVLDDPATWPTAGEWLRGRDASGRWRDLQVVEQVVEMEAPGLLLSCDQACRFTEGLVFEAANGRGRLVVAALPPSPGELLLRPGDSLRLTARPCQEAGTIVCSLPQVFSDVRVGERVLFDDGRIGAVIRDVSEQELLLEISTARAKGSRLRADQGINFPDSQLHTPALTAKDLEDLAFACRHADLISYSFVHRVADIEALHRALERFGREDLAVVLKIETSPAYINLPRLLLAAMRYPAPLGVMIARGDLAIECGWEALARIQEDILSLCGAAHVPCIWATQVLDEMARHGTPTRAEITDAAMGARAEALMLNKGPNITATVRTLQAIVERSQRQAMVSCLAFQTNCEPSRPRVVG